MRDEWRAIVGFPGYEVSGNGRIRSWLKSKKRPETPHEMSARRNRDGYMVVNMVRADGKHPTVPVHKVVAAAFLVDRPPGAEVRHLNGDPADNRIENLQWSSHAENMRDQLRHGTHAEARKTHCDNGHPFDEQNTYVNPRRPARHCRRCHNDRGIALRKRRRELAASKA